MPTVPGCGYERNRTRRNDASCWSTRRRGRALTRKLSLFKTSIRCVRFVLGFKNGDSQRIVKTEKIVNTAGLTTTRLLADEIDATRRECLPLLEIVLALDLALAPSCDP